MSRNPVVLGLLLIALCAAPGPRAREEGIAPGAAADGGTRRSTPSDSVAGIVGPLEKLRGLAFKEPPSTKEVGRDEARAYMSRLLKKEYPPKRLAAEQEAYVYFGLLEPGQDLEKMLLDLLEDQVAGFYDPETQTLYVIPGPLAASLALAHEMAHALADQHFDLKRLQETASVDDDRALALSGLIEGEATMVTSLWVIRSAMDPTMPPLATEDPAELIRAASEGLEDVPRFLKETLTFPYLAGSTWAAEIMRRGGGLKALDSYFAEPPDSTEQILHPERSLPPRDLPAVIDPGLLQAALSRSDPVIKQDTMGEFGIRLLFMGSGDKAAAAAGEGWDGDRYLLAGRKGARHLTWVSAWDSEADAEEFAASASDWLGRRASSDGGFSVRREGSTVVVAEGRGAEGSMPEERVASLMGRLAGGIHPR